MVNCRSFLRAVGRLGLVRATQVAFATAVASAAVAGAQGAPLGERAQLRSRVLGEQRELTVYLPPEYRDTTRRFPVIYLLDGESIFLTAAAAAQALQQDGAMPPAIVIGIVNTARERDFTSVPTHPEATPKGIGTIGGVSNFVRFVRDELVGYVDTHYRTVSSRMLIGHSLGGLAAMQMLAESPTTFRGFITLEPSLWWDRRAVADSVIRVVRAMPTLTGRLVAVERGTEDGWRPDSARLLAALPATFTGTFLVIPGVTHQQLPYRGIYEGLRALFDGYASRAAVDPGQASVAALEAQYGRLSKQLGYEIAVPLSTLLDAAQRRLEGRSAQDAIALLEYAAGKYPGNERVQLRLREARRELAAPTATRLVPFVPISVQEATRLVGEWIQNAPANGNAPPQRVRHRFFVRGDSLMHSAIVFFSADTTERFAVSEMPVSVTGDTITWERTNRAGGGYVVRLVRQPNGELVGDERGVDLPPPPPGIVNSPVPMRLAPTGNRPR